MKEQLKNSLRLENIDLLEGFLEMFLTRRLEAFEEKLKTREKENSAAKKALESKDKELKLLDINERVERLGKSFSAIDSRLRKVDAVMVNYGHDIVKLNQGNERLLEKVEKLEETSESKGSMIDQTISSVNFLEQQMQLRFDTIEAGANLSLQMENERLREQNIQLHEDNKRLAKDNKRLIVEAYNAVLSFRKALNGEA